MAKLDKNNLSKEQAKQALYQRRLEKSKNIISQNTVLDNELWILCLKHGTKYHANYVNKLYKGIKKHLSVPFKMACLTESPENIHPDIHIIPLPPGLSGWWYKPYIFSKDLPLSGTILYMDLDVIIANNLDHFVTHEPNNWVILRDFVKTMRPNWPKYNSSVIRFQHGQLDHLWQKFNSNPKYFMRRHHGDQDFIYDEDKTAKYWPDAWVRSWKWEIRKSREWAAGGTRGNRRLKRIENVVPNGDCSICVFHGDPNPHNCDDPWVVDNWHNL